MTFNRRPGARNNRGRIATASGDGTLYSQASASIGPHVSTQFYRVTAAGIANLSASTALICLWENRGMADETIFAYCDATSGYFINHNNTGTTGLFLRSGAPTSHLFTTNNPCRKVLNCLALTRTAGGAFRWSMNGAAGAQLTAAPSYVNAAATAECIIGRSPAAVGTSSMTTSRWISYMYLLAELTDAELQAYSNVVNLTNRFAMAPAAVTKLASVGGWHLDASRDCTPANATMTAGAGTIPPTWTKNGAALTKNTIPSFAFRNVQQSWIHDGGYQVSVLAQDGVTTYQRGQPFQRLLFTSDATEVSLRTMYDWSGVPAMIDVALDVSGAAQSNSTVAGAGIEATEFSINRVEDIYGLAASSKPFIETDGAASIVGGIIGGTIRGLCVDQIILPATATFSVTMPSVPTNRFLAIGDSITMGQQPSVSSAYNAAAMLIRADYPGSVTVEGAGSLAWYHLAATAPFRASWVARLGALANATGSNRLWINLGTNDYGFFSSCWGTTPAALTTFETAVGAFLDAYNAAYPTHKIHIQTPLDRLNETNLSPAGTGITLPQLRTSLGTVQSTRSSFCFLHDGTAALAAPPSADYQGDGIHLTTAGMANWKAWIKTECAASGDSVGSGY